MVGRKNSGNDGGEQTDGGVIHRETEQRAREPKAATAHEQPALERHELPGTIPVWEYHEYHHGDRWSGSEEWTELQTTVELPRGLHTIRIVIFDGGWKLGQLRFR